MEMIDRHYEVFCCSFFFLVAAISALMGFALIMFVKFKRFEKKCRLRHLEIDELMKKKMDMIKDKTAS